ncbi:CsgG/HfaB family protein [Hyalangium sp.]|uniref:CsgG/HfaB family protein n=1 Tax=Hyalangium sp. TaxID=2028555 RepID=UPI002D62B00D|nr:CsgG/HfaB family protein [Hyalangium sp.]HYH98276.1 CsgG/HfaB family protein [Hyalangium sp.]
MSRLLAFFLCALLLPAASVRAESTGTRRIVAVLYFDNNTGDASLDVLQKGFADMMVTDLSSVEQLQLVEREKLQQIIDEQKLQRTKYFDKKTAVKLGKLVGAQYAVSGSFQSMEPELRIDIKMFELLTGNVLVTGQVVGLKNKLFELQQQLVSRFVTGLELKLPHAPRLRSRAPDVDTLLSYSKGIDLVDQGKLEEARKQLAAVVSKAPTFLLARERHEQILARLKAAEAKRKETLTGTSDSLGQRAEQFLQSTQQAGLDEDGSARRLGYRLVRMRYLLRMLRPHLAKSYPYVILPGHESQGLALLQLWREQARAYVQESREHFRRFQVLLEGFPRLPSSTLKLLPEDEELLRVAKYGSLSFDDEATLSVAEFILLGRTRGDAESLEMGPTLADLDPTAMAEGLQLMEQALKEAEATSPREQEFRVRRVLELHGDALQLRGHVEEAIAKWQMILDRFPTSRAFPQISDKIKTALGVGPNQRDNAGKQYNVALASCEFKGIREGFDHETNRRMRTQGYKAAREMYLELEAKCGQEKEARWYLRTLLVSASMDAARSGDCDTFHALSPRFLELKGSQSDLDGYLKNHIPHCRREPEAGAVSPSAPAPAQ